MDSSFLIWLIKYFQQLWKLLVWDVQAIFFGKLMLLTDPWFQQEDNVIPGIAENSKDVRQHCPWWPIDPYFCFSNALSCQYPYSSDSIFYRNYPRNNLIKLVFQLRLVDHRYSYFDRLSFINKQAKWLLVHYSAPPAHQTFIPTIVSYLIVMYARHLDHSIRRKKRWKVKQGRIMNYLYHWNNGARHCLCIHSYVPHY
jgi:hypothetical protein